MASVPPSASHSSSGRPGSDPPGPLADRLLEVAEVFSRSQQQLVVIAAEFADSDEWVRAGATSAAAWLAQAVDVESCTAREWIRIGRLVRNLPTVAADFTDGTLSYSKVRTLTRVATADNEAELAGIARTVPASELGRAVAAWMHATHSPEEIAAHHQRQRSVWWRTDPDGMVTFTLRLPPLLAATLIRVLAVLVMRSPARRDASGDYPTLTQQRADAVAELLDEGAGTADTEIVFHVRGDGVTCDDGTPITRSVIADLVPTSFLRALIHDADQRPINASGRQRYPTIRQRRLVKERDRVCVDCGRADLLEYDHNPAYETTGHTVVDELELRCAPCHHKRHQEAA